MNVFCETGMQQMSDKGETLGFPAQFRWNKLDFDQRLLTTGVDQTMSRLDQVVDEAITV